MVKVTDEEFREGRLMALGGDQVASSRSQEDPDVFQCHNSAPASQARIQRSIPADIEIGRFGGTVPPVAPPGILLIPMLYCPQVIAVGSPTRLTVNEIFVVVELTSTDEISR